MPLVIDVFLQKDSSRGMFGGVGGKGERGRDIWELEDCWEVNAAFNAVKAALQDWSQDQG